MTPDELSSLASDFHSLFKTHGRSFIRWIPKSGNIITINEPIIESDFMEHFNAVHGVGCCPITENDDCYWAVIDIDNHGQDEDIPLPPIDKILMGANIPMIPCRSKSGGVHVYAFFEGGQPAKSAINYLKVVAEKIGYPNAEVYPKQVRLGKGQIGNSVNLPYFDVDNTNRYAYRDGKKLSAIEFVILANKFKINDHTFNRLAVEGHDDAPPCVQKMLMNGVAEGGRNEAAYQIGIYLRKAYPEEIESRMRDINNAVFSKPIGRQELTRTIKSAKNDKYQYKCTTDPQMSLCDREACITRKHGIQPTELAEIEARQAIPKFTDLTKFMSDPVRWEMKIDGKLVTGISTPQLLDWRFMREVIADKLTRVVPMIKPNEWERELSLIMEQVRIVDAPDDASISGVIRARMHDFAARADLLSPGTDTKDREQLKRGLPVVQLYQGMRMVMFRSQDFVQYLKRTRSEELKGVALWMAVKDIGVVHTKLRIGAEQVNIWMYPVDEAMKVVSEIDPIEFSTEI